MVYSMYFIICGIWYILHNIMVYSKCYIGSYKGPRMVLKEFRAAFGLL